MKQFSLRKVPPEVERRIRAVAHENNESLNVTINRILAQSLGVAQDGTRKRDLSDLAGTWTEHEAEEFERAIEQFAEIDAKIWSDE